MTAPARSDGTSTKNRTAAQKTSAQKTSAQKSSAQAGTTDTTVEQPEKLAPATRRTRSAAAERAYARRAQREGRRDGTARVRTRPETERRREPQPQSQPQPESRPRRQAAPRKQASTATFVVLVMSMLLVGVATTLWLSTAAIADSYKLDDAKKGVAALSEQAEQLRREVTGMDSASALARRAQELGMVPNGDPAYLVVGPDGKVRLVGDPKPVQAPKPPAGTTQPPAGTTQPPASTPPAGTTPPPAGTSTSTPPPANQDQNTDQHGQDHG